MEYTVRTTKPDEFINITGIIRQEVERSGIKEGVAVVFVPHTTAGVTINENADPDVVHDVLAGLRKAFPESGAYQHMEGNSDAHMKASVMGSSCTVIIENGGLKLGTWQGVYFCEFDGPRTRKVYIRLIKG